MCSEDTGVLDLGQSVTPMRGGAVLPRPPGGSPAPGMGSPCPEASQAVLRSDRLSREIDEA